MGKKIVSVLLALVFAACLPTAALAAGTDEHAARQPDYTKQGSIHVTLLTATERTPVPGGTLEMFKVALAEEKSGDNILNYTSEFEGCGVDLADLENPGTLQEMAKNLAAFAKEKNLSGTTANVASDGTADFASLPLGLYLITQPEALETYEPVDPFLVTVPIWDAVSGKLVYSVDAEPKCNGVIVMSECSVPVTKIITEASGKAPEGTEFSFQLTPGAKDYPMPENDELTADSETGAMTMTVTGAGEYDFGKIYFGLKDVDKTYTYKVQEVAGSVKGYTYDETVYTMTVDIKLETEKIVLNITVNDGTDDIDTGISFTNIYRNPASGTGLPQTGQLWWPVPVLLMLGTLLVGFGVYRNRRNDVEG